MGFLFAFWSTIIVYQIIELAEELDSQNRLNVQMIPQLFRRKKNLDVCFNSSHDYVQNLWPIYRLPLKFSFIKVR